MPVRGASLRLNRPLVPVTDMAPNALAVPSLALPMRVTSQTHLGACHSPSVHARVSHTMLCVSDNRGTVGPSLRDATWLRSTRGSQHNFRMCHSLRRRIHHARNDDLATREVTGSTFAGQALATHPLPNLPEWIFSRGAAFTGPQCTLAGPKPMYESNPPATRHLPPYSHPSTTLLPSPFFTSLTTPEARPP